MDAAANRPVVIYSHGYTSFPGQNTALLEELASHGYIVYSVQHTYDSSPVAFPNGDVVGMDPALMAEMERLATEMSEDQRLSFAGATFDERRRGTRASYEQFAAGGATHSFGERGRMAGGPRFRARPARGGRCARRGRRNRCRGRPRLGRGDRHVLRRLHNRRRLHGRSPLRGRRQPRWRRLRFPALQSQRSGAVPHVVFGSGCADGAGFGRPGRLRTRLQRLFLRAPRNGGPAIRCLSADD